MNARTPRLILAVLLALLGAGSAQATPPTRQATTAGGDVMRAQGCQTGAFVILSADPAVVRAQGHIPARWKLALDGSGRAREYLDTGNCEQTLDGRTRPVVWDQLSAELDSANLPSPERSRSTSDVEGKPYDLYLMGWSANDRDFVKWLKAGTGLGDDIVRYVPGLKLQMSGTGLRHYEFDAPKRNQSPFRLTASYTPNVIPVFPVESNFWRQTSAGSVLFDQAHTVPGIFGFFQQWAISTDPASPLGRMIGGGTQTRTCTATMYPAPLTDMGPGQDPGCLGVDEHDGPWTETKSVA